MIILAYDSDFMFVRPKGSKHQHPFRLKTTIQSQTNKFKLYKYFDHIKTSIYDTEIVPKIFVVPKYIYERGISLN